MNDVIIGTCPIQQGVMTPIVRVMQAEVRRGKTLGKLRMLTRWGQSEEQRQRRQSGVVDINGGLHRGIYY